MRLYVIDLDQDDPRKCTGKKMIHFGYAFYTMRPRGIVLNPISKRIISIEDKELVEKLGITVIDSSWKKSDETFFKKYLNKSARRLPYLLAGNPTNYAKPYMLSSLEAVSAALYILGYKDVAKKLLSLYKWGMTFYQLNIELLQEYSGKSESEIEKIEREIVGEPQ